MRLMLLLLLTFIVFNIHGQDYIWGGPGDKNSEFSGGLNDWTTFGFSNDVENSKAIFYWDADGNANAGAYAMDTEPIESSSVNNGAAAFDSDYLDSGGVDMGQGEVSSPHLSYLVSPVINLKNESEVTLKFNQSFRKYQSTTKVEVSNDNGSTWTAFEVNESLGENERLNYDFISLVDISSVAANHEAVQFRFVFEGAYYYWVLDDVSLIKTPKNELSLGDYLYPVNSRTMPWLGLDADTMKFWCDVKNSIGKEAANGTATVQIMNEDQTNVYWEYSESFNNLKKDSTQRIHFQDYVLPFDKFDVFNGQYFSVKYSVINGSVDGDLYNGDNVETNSIYVNNTNGISSLNEGNIGIGGASPFTIINVYETGSLLDYKTWFAKQITTGVSADNVSTISCSYVAHIWKVDKSVDDNLSQITGENSLDSEPLLTPVAYGYGFLKDHDIKKDFSLESGLLDIETDEDGVFLEPNTKYFVSIEYKDVDFELVGALRPHCGTSVKYFQPVVFIANDDGIYKLSNKSWAWKIILESEISPRIVNTKEEKELEGAILKVFPTPTNGLLNIDFSLDKTEEYIQLGIYNLLGQSLMQKSLKNVKSKQFIWNLNGLPSGQYLIRMNTSKGYKSSKFTKIE